MPEFLESALIFRDFGAGCEISLDSKTVQNAGKSIIQFFVAKISLQI